MTNQLEIEDYCIAKLQGMAVSMDFSVLILSKHLKGYVPDGRHLGIACNKSPAGIDQFTEVKVIHNVTTQYIRPHVRDNYLGTTTVDKFQGQVRRTYFANLRRKDHVHFGTREESRGPIEMIFR